MMRYLLAHLDHAPEQVVPLQHILLLLRPEVAVVQRDQVGQADLVDLREHAARVRGAVVAVDQGVAGLAHCMEDKRTWLY